MNNYWKSLHLQCSHLVILPTSLWAFCMEWRYFKNCRQASNLSDDGRGVFKTHTIKKIISQSSNSIKQIIIKFILLATIKKLCHLSKSKNRKYRKRILGLEKGISLIQNCSQYYHYFDSLPFSGGAIQRKILNCLFSSQSLFYSSLT